jgi:uncharacterized protein
MKLSLDYSTSKYSIQAYESDALTINQQRYGHNVVLSPEQLIEPWSPKDVHELTAEHIQQLLELTPEIILLGTGDSLVFPAPELSILALQQGIGFEVMDTGSACRTFNVLAAEDRNVVAALMIGYD